MDERFIDYYPDVLTPTDCMKILQVGRNTIYSLLSNGIIKSLKIGKQYRIPKKFLQSYLESCYDSDMSGSVCLQ